MPTDKERLIGLLDYVEQIARLTERAVLSLRSYRALMFYEHQLRNRVGIQHDVVDGEGIVWLRIERLQRVDPPTPDEQIESWLTISRDPNMPSVTTVAPRKSFRTNGNSLLVSFIEYST